MQLPPWPGSGKPVRRQSDKRTIILSCTRSEGTGRRSKHSEQVRAAEEQALRCEQHIPSHAHTFSHMSTARVMAQENKFVAHHCHLLSSVMSLLRIDPDSLTSFFSATSPTTLLPDPAVSMTTHNLTRTTTTPPVERFSHLANTTPRTVYEPNFIHETDTTIFDQTDYWRKPLSVLQTESLPQKAAAASRQLAQYQPCLDQVANACGNTGNMTMFLKQVVFLYRQDVINLCQDFIPHCLYRSLLIGKRDPSGSVSRSMRSRKSLQNSREKG